MKEYVFAGLIFLMGFLFVLTPLSAVLFLNHNRLGLDLGIYLKNILNLLGVAMMVYGAVEVVKTRIKQNK